MKKDKINKKGATVSDPEQPRADEKISGVAYEEPAIPVFLCLVCMSAVLIAALINAFVYSFESALLAPVILEIVAIVFPCYLILLTVHSQKTTAEQFKAVGFHAFGVRYIFFILFGALFMMSASAVISILFGGVYSFADGLTLLGTFTAGSNDYTASIPYLILAYALIPAIAEEFLLRGMVFSSLRGMGFAAAAVISAVLSGLVSFSLGGFIPAAFIGLVACFVLYTTGSLWACMIVRFIFNLYRLFLEVNISAYFVSSSSRELLIVVMLAALLIFGALFFGECARLYKEKADRAKSGESEHSTLALRGFVPDIKKTVAYRPTAIMAICCAAVFAAVVIVNYLS